MSRSAQTAWRCAAVSLATVLATGGVASAATITNGGFSNGLTGWTQVNHGSGSWQRVTFTGPSGSLQNGYTVPADPGQPYAAGTTQSGAGDHFLYQDVALESGESHQLSLDYRWQNYAGRFYTPTSLSYTTSPNEQARIDVIKPGASIQTVASSDLLASVVATTTSSPLQPGWMHASVDLSAFAGQTVRVRLAEVDNQSFFSLDVTNVSLVSKVLNTPPQVAVTGVDDGASYEFGSVPAAGCAVTDAEDGPSTTPASQSAITGPRAAAGLGAQTASCSYTDAGGLTATASATYAIVDTTPPVLTMPDPQSAEASGPGGASVTFTAPTAVDAVDGPVTPLCDHAPGDTFPLGTTTVTCTATDMAGNSSSASSTVTVADTTPPTVTPPSDVAATATSISGASVTYPAATATDLVDGAIPPTCTPASGSVFPLGTTTVSCTATDHAANTGTATFKVVVSYAWSGVLQPVNSNGSTISKLGSTVPVKFALTGPSAVIGNATATLSYAKVTDGVDGPALEATSTAAATSGNLFRLDTTSGQYIFNWSTKGLTVGTYRLTIDLGDGVRRTVTVSLK